MKRINTFCALILLLVTSSSAYAGVTADGTTAYRAFSNTAVVVFTDEPLDDPTGGNAPLGANSMNTTSCTSGNGSHLVDGLVCIGTSGDPVADYTCPASTGPPNASNTAWCLFSENPRHASKRAWAVKYVNGEIPTNDGASIVRCKKTDRFDPETGCRAPPQISIEGGFIKLDTRANSAPADVDCAVTAHNGKMVFDEITELLYICADSGWISK